MEKTMRRLIQFTLAASLFATASLAHDYQKGSLFIDHPWSRATPHGAAVAGGYLVIENKGTSPDRLIGGSAEIAGRVEIHEMSMQGGVMKMRPLARGLEIKGGGSAKLAPGGYHIMFVDLKRPLGQGERFKAVLQFEKAGAIEVEFAVEAMGAGEHKPH
jgi:copper(I)-binding protein